MPKPRSIDTTAVDELFQQAGATGKVLREMNWRRHALGAPRTWPPSLRTVLGLCLAAREPAFVVWGESRIFFYNDACAPLLGSAHPRALGESFATFADEPWARPLQSALAEPAAGRASVCPDVALPIPHNGARRETSFRVSLTPIRAQDGEVGGVFGTLSESAPAVLPDDDATPLPELYRAERSFLSGVGDEFRSALTLVLGPLEQELAQTPAGAARHERLALAHRNSLRLLKLIHALQEFSRLDTGRAQASCEPTDLAELTIELAAAFRSTVERAGLQLEVNCPRLPQPVYVDRAMWTKIVLHLISNALKFTFTGTIRVALRAHANAAELTVRDTGIGIPPAELAHVFERFHRAESARGRTLEGTGLGLALVQEFAKLHGGAVTVKSTPAHGSTFLVRIPFGHAHLPPAWIGTRAAGSSTAVQAEAFVEEAAHWLQNAPDLHGFAHATTTPSVSVVAPQSALPEFSHPARGEAVGCVLLAEGNADLREYVRHTLANRFTVIAVADGEAALAAVREVRPDLVLANVASAHVNGLALLRALRADPQTQSIPVILLSARAGEDSQLEGLTAGADDYLIQPFSARELETRVAARIELARVRRGAMERERALRAEATTAVEALERAERDLMRKTRELTAFIETAALGLHWTGPDGIIIWANAAELEMLGYRREEYIGHHIAEFHADQDAIAEVLARLSRNEEVRDFETRLRCKDGATKTVLIDANVLWEEGRFVHSQCFTRDITERRQAEESSRLLAAIIESSDDAIISRNLAGIVTSWNRGAERLFGYSAAEATGESMAVLVPADRMQEERDFLARIRRGEHIDHHETVRCRRDGANLDVSLTVSPIKDSRGNVVGASAIAHDITARKRGDQATRLLAAVVQSSDDAIVTKNLNGTITSWNRGAERLFGYTAREAIGRPVTMLIPQDRQQEEIEILSRIRRGEPIEHYSTVRVRKDGGMVEVSLTVSPVRDETGVIVGASKIARDISALKAAERALRESEQRFSAFMRHLPGAAWIKDLDGRYIYANHRAEEVFSRRLEEVLGRTDHDIFAAASARTFRANDLQAIAAGSFVNVEILRQADGIDHHSLVSKFAIPGLSGQVEYVAGVAFDITDRVTALSALRESEEQMRLVTDAAPALVAYVDRDLRYRFANRRYEEWLAYPRQHVLGHTMREVLGDTILARLRPFIDRALAGENVHLQTEGVPYPDGRQRWIDGYYVPHRGPDRRVLGFYMFILDDTERKRAESELAESRERLAIALDAGRMGWWEWDIASNRLRWSAEVYHTLGFATADFEPDFTTWRKVLHPDDADRVEAALTRSLEEKCDYEAEYRVVWPDQSVHWIMARGRARFDAAGAATRLTGVCFDLTHLKRAAADLQRSERMYRALGESIDYGVWICDPAGRNTYASDSFLKLVGLTQAQCSEFGWSNALHPDEAASTLAAWQECVRTGGRWERVHRLRGADGAWRSVLTRGIPIRDERGAIECWAGINLDITRFRDAPAIAAAAGPDS